MLTQFVLTNAKPKATPYKLSDGEGLHVLVKPNGTKLWRLKYRYLNNEKLVSFGSFPEVPITEARDQRREARIRRRSRRDVHEILSDRLAAAKDVSRSAPISDEQLHLRRPLLPPMN